MLNVWNIEWRMSQYGFDARVWLCPDCWARYTPFITNDEDQRGVLHLRWDSLDPDAVDRNIRFHSKGIECIETRCTDCGKELVAAEEVWLHTS